MLLQNGAGLPITSQNINYLAKMSKVTVVTIDAEQNAGQRLDNFLIGCLKGVPKTRIYKAIRKGEVRVNGGRKQADYKLLAGDEVRIPPLKQSAASTNKLTPQMQIAQRVQGAIIFEDDNLLAINKPVGIPVHGGTGLAGGVIEILRVLRPQAKFLELVHRLDKETSGCLLIAKKRSALLALHQLLNQHQIQKTYLARVKGRWSKRKSKVDLPLVKNRLQSGERMVKVNIEEGREALSFFEPLQYDELTTLVRVTIKTGRTHQIRVHASASGHPIAGDVKYGDAEFNQHLRRQGMKRMYLHAERLVFDLGDKHYDITAPCEYW